VEEIRREGKKEGATSLCGRNGIVVGGPGPTRIDPPSPDAADACAGGEAPPHGSPGVRWAGERVVAFGCCRSLAPRQHGLWTAPIEKEPVESHRAPVVTFVLRKSPPVLFSLSLSLSLSVSVSECYVLGWDRLLWTRTNLTVRRRPNQPIDRFSCRDEVCVTDEKRPSV